MVIANVIEISTEATMAVSTAMKWNVHSCALRSISRICDLSRQAVTAVLSCGAAQQLKITPPVIEP